MMLLRGLPLYTGIAPVVAVTLAYWLGVSNEVLPACMPLFDGCTSISATGRHPPGSYLFRAVMLPQAVVLALLWYLSADWLDTLIREERSNKLLLASGLLGALALVLYVTFLGTRLPIYEVMRRFGIYFYFLGTALAQLTLAFTLLKFVQWARAGRLRQYALAMLWLCGLPFALGILNLVLKAMLDNADFMENRIEWISAVLMQGYFVVLYLAWRHTDFKTSVQVN
jgi:hypothetical protein